MKELLKIIFVDSRKGIPAKGLAILAWAFVSLLLFCIVDPDSLWIFPVLLNLLACCITAVRAFPDNEHEE